MNSSHVLHLAIFALASSVIKFKAWKSRRIEQYPEYRKVPLEWWIIKQNIKIQGYLNRVSHCGILYGSRYFVESRLGNPSNENPFQVENFFCFFNRFILTFFRIRKSSTDSIIKKQFLNFTITTIKLIWFTNNISTWLDSISFV